MSSRKSSVKKVAGNTELTIVLPPIKAPKWLQGFIEFIREQGVVGIALGITIGFAAKTVVDSLVANIFNPTLSLIAGRGSLENRYICMRNVEDACTSKLGYGQFITDILSFILLLGIFYLLIKTLKLEKLDKKSTEK